MGKLPIASLPLLTTSHNAAGESTPPGNRHAIPTTTMGSSTAGAARARTGIEASEVPVSCSSRYPARAVGVGWSKTRVEGKVRPVCGVSASRRSSAITESTPRSLKAVAGSIVVGSGRASTAAVALTTRAVTVARWSSGVWPASCVVSGLEIEVVVVRSLVRNDGGDVISVTSGVCQ
ncbi:hypothetical protein MSIMFI_03436 [Mycobacterium simulans]|nr:hypothetical protein MSIMFI_03436 [Mycobacterium simulans]